MFLLIVGCSPSASNRVKDLTESTRNWAVDDIGPDYWLVRISIQHGENLFFGDNIIWLITIYYDGENKLVFRGSLDELNRNMVKIPKADDNKFLIGVKGILLNERKEYSWSSDQLNVISIHKKNKIMLLDDVDDSESVTLIIE